MLLPQYIIWKTSDLRPVQKGLYFSWDIWDPYASHQCVPPYHASRTIAPVAIHFFLWRARLAQVAVVRSYPWVICNLSQSFQSSFCTVLIVFSRSTNCCVWERVHWELILMGLCGLVSGWPFSVWVRIGWAPSGHGREEQSRTSFPCTPGK